MMLKTLTARPNKTPDDILAEGLIRCFWLLIPAPKNHARLFAPKPAFRRGGK